MQVRYSGPVGTYETVGISSVLGAMMGDTSAVDPEIFRGKIVLIGYTASDLMDLKPMPYSPRCPGVEVIASATDNIIQNRYVRTPGTAATVLLTILLALGVASALVFIPGVIPASLSGLAAVAFYGALSLLSFRNADLWLETVPPLTAGLLTLLAGSVVAYRFATREKRFLKTAFSSISPPRWFPGWHPILKCSGWAAKKGNDGVLQRCGGIHHHKREAGPVGPGQASQHLPHRNDGHNP